jgi:hypothetical protein
MKAVHDSIGSGSAGFVRAADQGGEPQYIAQLADDEGDYESQRKLFFIRA